MRQVLVLLPLLVLGAPRGGGAVPAPPSPPAASQQGPGRSGVPVPSVSPLMRRGFGAPSGEEPPLQAAVSGRPHAFYFARAAYGSYGGRGRGFRGRQAWATDYPKADLQLLTVLRRLLPTLDLYQAEFPIRLTDPELRRYPYIYAVEVSNMRLSDEEVEGLRSYLLAGGFLFVDDFWGTYEWAAFEEQLKRVFPDRPIIELPLDNPIFKTYYDIDKIVQVPNVDNICYRGQTSEQDGYVPHVRAVLDDDGRVMVLISWNSDLGDAWEWAEQACYPLEYSTYAFQLTVNTIVYAMSR